MLATSRLGVSGCDSVSSSTLEFPNAADASSVPPVVARAVARGFEEIARGDCSRGLCERFGERFGESALHDQQLQYETQERAQRAGFQLLCLPLPPRLVLGSSSAIDRDERLLSDDDDDDGDVSSLCCVSTESAEGRLGVFSCISEIVVQYSCTQQRQRHGNPAPTAVDSVTTTTKPSSVGRRRGMVCPGGCCPNGGGQVGWHGDDQNREMPTEMQQPFVPAPPTGPPSSSSPPPPLRFGSVAIVFLCSAFWKQ